MTLFFTKRKFQTYSLASQHKKAAECAKRLYLSLLYNGDIPSSEKEQYDSLSNWMQLPKISYTLEELSSRYHLHQSYTFKTLREHQFLPKVEHLDKSIARDYLPIDIYLDQIRSSFNIGSIMRTNEAMRLGSLFFSKEMAAPSHKKVLDTAMGSEKFQQIKRLEDPQDLRGPLIAVETTQDATSIYDFNFPKTFTLIFGNEEFGVSSNWLAKADATIKIPLYGIKNSLNVASAFSIVASEIRRQLG